MHYSSNIIIATSTCFSKGKVCYQLFDDDSIADQPILDEVNLFIQKKHNTSFNGVWMIVVEWRNIHAYPHSFATRNPHFYTEYTWTLLNKVIKLCSFQSIHLFLFYDLFIDKHISSYNYYRSFIINLCNLHI